MRPGSAAGPAPPVPARTENLPPQHPAAAATRARCPFVTAPGSPLRPGRGAPPATTPRRVGAPPPPPPPAAAASRGRRRSGRCPCGAPRGRRGPPNCAAHGGSPGRRSGHQGDGSPECITIAGPGVGRPEVGSGGSAGARAALVSPPRAPYTVWGLSLVGPRATGRLPGLPPDSGLLTRIAAVPASSR